MQYNTILTQNDTLQSANNLQNLARSRQAVLIYVCCLVMSSLLAAVLENNARLLLQMLPLQGFQRIAHVDRCLRDAIGRVFKKIPFRMWSLMLKRSNENGKRFSLGGQLHDDEKLHCWAAIKVESSSDVPVMIETLLSSPIGALFGRSIDTEEDQGPAILFGFDAAFFQEFEKVREIFETLF